VNFTEHMNARIYTRYAGGMRTMAIGERKSGAYRADVYVDLDDADVVCDLDGVLPKLEAEHVRLGEVLEHLTNDAALLRRIKAKSLLVTVPYYGEAPYHVRMYNRWSVEQLLSATGWRVEEYIPRKAPRLDLLIACLRGVFGQWINGLFYLLNPYLPMKPNGGYFHCLPTEPVSFHEINRREFRTR